MQLIKHNGYILTDMPFKILFVTATAAEADALKMIPGIKNTSGWIFIWKP